MKYCSKCGTGFEGVIASCPHDGEPLIEDTTRILDGSVETSDGGEGLEKVLGEIDDLIFRSCPSCHASFAGGLEVCPHDGSRLSEHSLLARETLIHSQETVGNGVLQFRKYCPACKRQYPLHQRTCEGCGAPLEVPTIELGAGHDGGARSSHDRAGQLIAGKYRLLQSIGRGGFGSVFLAKHESLGKRFAVKVLKGQLSNLTNFRDRFHEEALKLSRLEDENIVKVIDFGEWEDSQYMVTEYVEGTDLGAVIYGEEVPPLRAAKVLAQVAKALAEAHAKGIVHLDLKPANILVSEKRGRDLVKVIDFGIAEIYSEKRGSRQERICGTSAYMAPEQWRQGAAGPPRRPLQLRRHTLRDPRREAPLPRGAPHRNRAGPLLRGSRPGAEAPSGSASGARKADAPLPREGPCPEARGRRGGRARPRGLRPPERERALEEGEAGGGSRPRRCDIRQKNIRGVGRSRFPVESRE